MAQGSARSPGSRHRPWLVHAPDPPAPGSSARSLHASALPIFEQHAPARGPPHRVWTSSQGNAPSGACKLGAACVLAGAAPPGPAAAHVRYLTVSGNLFAWPQSCVPLTAYPNDLTDMTPDAVLNAASGRRPRGPCRTLSYIESSSTGRQGVPQAKYDRATRSSSGTTAGAVGTISPRVQLTRPRWRSPPSSALGRDDPRRGHQVNARYRLTDVSRIERQRQAGPANALTHEMATSSASITRAPPGR